MDKNSVLSLSSEFGDWIIQSQNAEFRDNLLESQSPNPKFRHNLLASLFQVFEFKGQYSILSKIRHIILTRIFEEPLAQWYLVLGSRLMSFGFGPHWGPCVVSLSKTHFILCLVLV